MNVWFRFFTAKLVTNQIKKTKYVKTSKRTLTLLDHKCLSNSLAKQIHCHLTVTATLNDPFAAAKLLSFYSLPSSKTCQKTSQRNDLSYAYKLFDQIQCRSTFIWNTMIGVHVERTEPGRACGLYKQMLASKFMPNNYTLSLVLRACSDLSDTVSGLCLHAQAVKLGWESYDFVRNGLVHLYAKCGLLGIARMLFDLSSYRDVVTWTTLLNGYVKAGDIVTARDFFDKMPKRNSVSWSVMINGYVEAGLYNEALEIFGDMQVSGFRPNHGAIVGVLTACAVLGALDQGRWMHAYVKKNEMELDVVLGSVLLDMYAKCGCIDMACNVFEEMKSRDVFAFTCLISGLANHGRSTTALKYFERMQNEGVVPNGVTFICLLNACSHMGLVDAGLKIFRSMKTIYGIDPSVEHYGCLVDLLGRPGKLEEAKKVVMEMPMAPDSYVLGALLNACRVHGDVEFGKEVVESVGHRSLDHDGVHILLSNIYASANKWDDVEKVRKGMEDRNLTKVPGCSSIEVNGMVCEFVAGDGSNGLMEEIKSLRFGIDKHLTSTCLDYDDMLMV